MVYIDKQDIKKELSKKETKLGESPIEEHHRASPPLFFLQLRRIKGNISLIIMVEYLDTIQEERKKYWGVSH